MGNFFDELGEAIGNTTNSFVEEAGKFIDSSAKTIGEVADPIVKEAGKFIDSSGSAIGEVTNSVVKFTGEVVDATGKIAGDTVNTIQSIDLFNMNLRRKVIDDFNLSSERYKEVSKRLVERVDLLYSTRLEAISLVEEVEERINNLSNTPKKFIAVLQEIAVETEKFSAKQAEIKRLENDAKLLGAGSNASTTMTLLGVTTATMGPTVAMAIATTFGTASTGTAISALSGAAANSAALAWLGGGALASGGGGMAAGSALITLAGPVGWAITAIAFSGALASGILASNKNKELAEKAIKEKSLIEKEIKFCLSKDEEIHALLKTTQEQMKGVMESCSDISGNDYMLFTDNEKYQVGVLVNSTLTLAQLINKEIVLDGEKETK